MEDELEKTKARLREVAGEALGNLMSDISEDHYAAGWNMGLEYDLWTILRRGSGSYGMGRVEPENVQKLRDLSRDAEGWHDGDNVIPIADWRREYARWFEVEHLPVLRRHVEFVRGDVGKTDPLGRVTTEAHVANAAENVASAEAELSEVRREAAMPEREAVPHA